MVGAVVRREGRSRRKVGESPIDRNSSISLLGIPDSALVKVHGMIFSALKKARSSSKPAIFMEGRVLVDDSSIVFVLEHWALPLGVGRVSAT